MVSVSNAFKCAPVFYRNFQLSVFEGIKSGDNKDTISLLSDEAIVDLKWWYSSKLDSMCPVSLKGKASDLTLFNDASLKGWGYSLSSGLITSGTWSKSDSSNHINFLELKSVYLAVLKFFPSLRGKKISIRSDNRGNLIRNLSSRVGWFKPLV